MDKIIDTYSNPFVEGWNKVATERHKNTVNFLIADKDKILGNVLDVGGDSPFGQLLERTFGIKLFHTDFDLDSNDLAGMWDNIFSFEVIEHLGNPLNHLVEMKRHLNPGGIIWLSTPLVVSKLRPTHLFTDPFHVFEMDWRQISFLINKADLQVERKHICRYLANWKYFTGPRPLIRFFTDRCVLLKLSTKI